MKNSKRVWEHVWYLTEEDLLGFKVFQIITIPLSLLLIMVLYIFTKSGAWSILMWFWLFVSIGLRIVSSLRFSALNKLNK
jgi:hypothetical protein